MTRLPLLCLAVLLVSCGGSSTDKAVEKAPAPPPEPVTGRYAMNQMYIAARAWASDIEPLSLVNVPLGKFPQKEGKAMAWQAVFVSPSLAKSRTYTWSANTVGDDVQQGVTPGAPESYTRQATEEPFILAALRKDSEDAYQVALKHSAEYRQKYPAIPINFRLEKVREFTDPAWRVYWGDSVTTSGFSVYVDASNGDFLRTGR